MWPKAIAQLIELAPHITRLVPVADRFLNSKAASEDASRSAMQQMAEGLRGDLGQVTAAHAGLYQKLNEQSEQLAGIAAEVRTTGLSITSLDERLLHVERQTLRLMVILGIAVVLLVALCVLSIFVLAHFR